jgi:hypothetical protein
MANEERARQFVEHGGRKIVHPLLAGTDKEASRAGKKHRKTLGESPIDYERRLMLRGVLLAQLVAQGEPFHCSSCGTCFDTLEDAWTDLYPGHIEPRRKGRRLDLRRGIVGIDHPSNIRPLCSACNASEHFDEARPFDRGGST